MTQINDPLAGGDGESSRCAALHALELMDTDPEEDFDTLVTLAAQLLDCPSAFISLVDRDRVWMKARANVGIAECQRDIAFCDYTIRGNDLLVIEDTARDPRFETNALAIGPDGIRFYAGAPIHAPDAAGIPRPIGSVCVIDTVPRTPSPRQQAALISLASLVDALIAARIAARRATQVARLADQQARHLARHARTFRQAERMAGIGAWRISLASEELEWSEGMFRIHGRSPKAVPDLADALEHYPPEARGIVADAMARAIEAGTSFDFEVNFNTADGRPRRVRCTGEAELVDDAAVALVGVFQDITEQHSLEQTLRRSADTDELTGIANRAAFNRRLEAAIATAHEAGTPLMLAMVDLDGFKAINDTLGHLAGDDVLRAVGRRLEAPWLKQSFAARLGGDEFALVIHDPALCAMPERVTRQLESELCVPVRAGGLTIAAAGTVGVRLLTPDILTVRDLVHAADGMLYAAKRRRVGEGRRLDRRAG